MFTGDLPLKFKLFLNHQFLAFPRYRFLYVSQDFINEKPIASCEVTLNRL